LFCQRCARSVPATPRPLFFDFRCKQSTYSIRRLGDPCATLGWPLGHAWATLGPPKGHAIPNPMGRDWRGVERPCFSDHQMPRSPDHPIFTALCLRPSARDPTPLKRFVETKAQPQFDSPFDRPVEAFLAFFRGQIRFNFSLLFPLLLFGRQRVATCKSRAAQ